MTADEWNEFAAAVRAEADAALARLDTVNREALPLSWRAEYDTIRSTWETLRQMTAPDVIALQIEASEMDGRSLTAKELRALMYRH